MAEFLFHKGSPTYLHTENADVMNISQFMAQNLRQPPPPLPPPPKHTFEISEGESVEIEKIVAAEKKDGQLFYKVKWVKYTWEAEESIQHLPHLIDGYWREHFYQNINQAVIDTGITGVATGTEADYTRNKSVTTDSTKTNATGTVSSQPSQPAAEGQQPQTQVGEKVAVTTEQPTAAANADVLTAAVAAANVGGEHNNVILEFSMAQSKVDHTYPNRMQGTAAAAATTIIQQTTGEKKARRSYPLERKYVCAICNKAFDRNTSLTRHMLVHTREKPFKCQLCDKAFSQNAHLKRHILIHIGQKSYQCNKCGKMFIEKGGLARHEATHSTEKPWVCNQCGKSFVLNEYLQRHLFLHTGQKPYQCNECGRLFADGSSWRAHKLTHNKEKKYKCEICQKMLKCKRNFKKHVEAHSDTKDMKHKCGICEQRFASKKLLKEHTRRARKNHRCPTCRRFLKSKERYAAHMEYHNPSSEKYDPNAQIPGDELDDDDGKSTDNEGSTKSDDETNHKSDNEGGEGRGANTSSVVDGGILNTILEGESSGGNQSEQNTGSAVSALTALIMKAEGSEEDHAPPSQAIHLGSTIDHSRPNVSSANMGNVTTPAVPISGTPDPVHNAPRPPSALNLGLQLPSSSGNDVVQQQQQQHLHQQHHQQQHPHHHHQSQPQQQQKPHHYGETIGHITSTGHLDPINRTDATSHNIPQNVGAMQMAGPTIHQQQQQQHQQHSEQNTTVSHDNILTNTSADQRRADDADVAETIILITQNNDVDMPEMKL